MTRRSASSPHAGSNPRNEGASNASRWRPNPYAKRFTDADRHLLTVRAIAAELGPEFALLDPDVAAAFPDSETVNETLRLALKLKGVLAKPKRTPTKSRPKKSA